jgi:hypothetical protein
MDNIIGILRKQVKIKELRDRFMPPYHPFYSQQFYYPNILGQFMQRTPVFSTPSFHQPSPAISMNSINISSPSPVSDEDNKNLSGAEASIKPKFFQLILLRGLMCNTLNDRYHPILSRRRRNCKTNPQPFLKRIE